MSSPVNVVLLVIWLTTLVSSKPFTQNEVDRTRRAADPAKSEQTPQAAEDVAVGCESVLKHMRSAVNNLTDLTSKKDLQEIFDKIENLAVSELPSSVDTKNNTAVETFQRLYRTYHAIMQWRNEDDTAYKFKYAYKGVWDKREFRKHPILMAEFSLFLSQFTDEQCQKANIDWEEEDAVINTFKGWRFGGSDDVGLQNVAKALYRMRPPKLGDKKIRVHAPDIEKEALTQFSDCYSKDFVLEAVLMPDAHSGYVAPIGSVIKTKGAVVPAWVGYDIGCGMIAVKIADKKTDQQTIQDNAKAIFNEVNRNVPMGVGGHNKRDRPIYLVNKMDEALNKLKLSTSYERLYRDVEEKSEPNLGTLGSGNHFIEISTHKDETWLVIHSGSRNVGHHIGTTFMKMVSGRQKGYENTFAIKEPQMRDEYMYYQDYCLEFALLNRMSMAMKVEEAILRVTGIEYNTYDNLWTNKNHNHCIKVGDNIYLHRKGATSSDKGERGVIPGNMRDGCYLVEGMGNEDFLCSSSHGAGRQMSRKEAQRKVGLDSFRETMKGVVAPINPKTIDESPFAYKNISRVMEYQKESVKVLKHLKPIINWKGY